MTRYERIVNNGTGGTLNGSLTNVTTSVVVNDSSIYPSKGDFRVQVDSEAMQVTSISGNTLTVVRGVDGSAAVSHTDGTAIQTILTQSGLKAVFDDATAGGSYRNPSRLQDSTGATLTSSDFTGENAGSNTVTDDADGGITLKVVDTGSSTWTHLYRTPPADPWIVTACLAINGMDWTAATFSYGGLMARRAATQVWVGIRHACGADLKVGRYSSVTDTTATVKSNTTLYCPQPVFWHQIEDNSTNLIYRVSLDGVVFHDVYSVGRTVDHSAAVDGVGFTWNRRGPANKTVTLKSWIET